MPFAPRSARKRSGLARRGRTPPRRGSASSELSHTSASSGSAGSSARRDLALERLRPLGERLRHQRVGLAPGAEPGRIRVGRPRPRARRAAPRAGAARHELARRASARASSRAGRSRSACACREPRAQRLRHRRARPPAARGRDGARRRSASRAEQHVVVRHTCERSWAPQRTPEAGRPAPASRAWPRARATGSATGSGASPHTITPRAADRNRAATSLGVGSAVERPHARSTARPSARPAQSAASSSSGTGRQRLAQREVQVHRARAGRDPAVATARQASARWCTALARARLVVAHLHEPLGRAAVELELVDRLPGADVAQLRRAVGGEHEQRHRASRASATAGCRLAAAVPEVHVTATGRAGRPGDPEGDEARRALVDHRHALDPVRAPRSASSDRRVARAGQVTAWVTPQRASSSTNACTGA